MNFSAFSREALSRRQCLSLMGLAAAGAAAALAGIPAPALASGAKKGLGSAEVNELFARMALEGRPNARLQAWLTDPDIQLIRPYRVFDNVWNVGVRWVSAYVIKTEDGVILIDTVHEPFAKHLVRSIEEIGVELKDIRCVLMTHGHFDHVGGAARLKPLAKNARFAMTQAGWDEAFAHAKGPRGFAMLPSPDLVLRDGDRITAGSTSVTALHTPGHTRGTASYLYDVCDGSLTRRAVTIGGLGLNAIESVAQLDAYVASMERLASPELGITTDLTAHPFSIGLTEMIPEILAHRPGGSHPLADRKAFLARLDVLKKRALDLRQSRFGKA